MRMVLACAFALALTGPGAARHLAALGIDGDVAEVRQVISGHTCVSADGDVLTFGKSQAGSSGTFEHTGRPAGSYAIGFATLLVKRHDGLHSHVIAVSPEKSTLHLGGIAYRCQPTRVE